MEQFKKNIEKFLPFLEDLQFRLYRGVILFAATFGVGFLSAGVILKKLLNFVQIEQVVIATSSPFQFADIAMDVGFFLAIIVSAPYIVYSLYAFTAPALTKQEKRALFKTIPVSIGLFVVGFVYGFSILYYALGMLAAINSGLGIANFWNIGQFLSQVLVTSALLGFVFEFPLVLSLLIKLGIITPTMLRNNRRIAYFLVICLTSLLPPTDGVSLIAMALPLVLLYEATIFLNRKHTYVWTGT